MRLPLHYHRIGRLYGPGMPPTGEPGPGVKTIERDPGQVGLVLVHCWNLGEADGPYPIRPENPNSSSFVADACPATFNHLVGRAISMIQVEL